MLLFCKGLGIPIRRGSVVAVMNLNFARGIEAWISMIVLLSTDSRVARYVGIGCQGVLEMFSVDYTK